MSRVGGAKEVIGYVKRLLFTIRKNRQTTNN